MAMVLNLIFSLKADFACYNLITVLSFSINYNEVLWSHFYGEELKLEKR